MLMKIIKGDFLSLDEVNPDVPKPVRELVEKMMQTDPQNRYANTGELLKALRETEKALTLPETALSGAAVIGEPEPEPVTSGMDAHFHEKKKHSGAWAALTVAAVIVLLMGGAYAAKVLYFDKKAKESKIEPTVLTPPTIPTSGEPAEDPDTGIDEPGEDPDAGIDEPADAGDKTGLTGPAGTGDAAGAEEMSTTPAQPVVKVRKPVPPSNSVVVSIFGDQGNEDMIAAYVQDSFSHADFTVIDGPSAADKKPGDIARYHLVMTVRLMATDTLSYYGSSTTQYTLGLTMKAIDTARGTIAAGPITAAVKYTSVNIAENLKEAVQKLTSR
jgi:hypothetical protein